MRYHPVRNNGIGPRRGSRSAHPLAFFFQTDHFFIVHRWLGTPILSSPGSFQGPRYRRAKGKWTRVFLEPRYSRDLRDERKFVLFDQAWRGWGYISSQFLSYIWEFRRICFCLTYAQWAAPILALSRSIKSVSKIPDFSSLLRKHSPFLLVRKKFPTSSTCMEIFEYKFSSFRRGVKFDLVVTWSRGRDNYVVKKMTIITRNRSNYVETSSPLSFLTNFIKSLHKNKFKVESKFAVVFV